MTEFTCIYCRQSLPVEEFSREHVIPQAFGTFENNLTLIDCVCRDCNQYFGDHLEVIVARSGSLEALHRLDKGITSTDRVRFLSSDRVVFSWSTEGEWDGLKLELRGDGGRLIVTPVLQVRFYTRDGKGRVFIPEWYLADLSNPLPKEVDPRTAIPIFGSEEMRVRLVETLSAHNVELPEGGARSLPIENGSQIQVDSITALDAPVKRLMAKIAFNYLALNAGANFALNRDFDPIRNYVRYGTEPGFQVILVTSAPILADDSATHRQTSGHLVTLNWPARVPHIVGQVSLFNHLRYDVLLARSPDLIWRNINSGHHFDIENRQIAPLRHTGLGLFSF